MRTLLNYAFAVLMLSALASCERQTDETETEEEEEISPEEKALTREAITGSYLVTKVEMQSSSGRQDITNQWFNSYAGNCAKDDVTQFKPDKSFVISDGSVVCMESTDDTGTWDVIGNSKLKLDSDTAVVEQWNATTLRFVHPVYSSAQGAMIFTYTRE